MGVESKMKVGKTTSQKSYQLNLILKPNKTESSLWPSIYRTVPVSKLKVRTQGFKLPLYYIYNKTRLGVLIRGMRLCMFSTYGLLRGLIYSHCTPRSF